MAACRSSVRVCVYLSVKRLIDVHSVVLALLDEHVSTLPDESCGRVRVDGAAKEHCLFLVVAATHVADSLVNCQNWRVKVCKIQKTREKEKRRTQMCLPGCTLTRLRPGTLLVSTLCAKHKRRAKGFVRGAEVPGCSSGTSFSLNDGNFSVDSVCRG